MTLIDLTRLESSRHGVVGALLIDGQFVCLTLERPWRENQKNVSCIPTGQYNVVKYASSKFKDSYLVEDVKDRSGILFHKGNTITDTEGCILLGQIVTRNSHAITLERSTQAFEQFKKLLQKSTEIKLYIR